MHMALLPTLQSLESIFSELQTHNRVWARLRGQPTGTNRAQKQIFADFWRFPRKQSIWVTQIFAEKPQIFAGKGRKPQEPTEKFTFAIATWRGDAQRYWLTQVLEPARTRHDQWLQSPLAQRATFEPAYILGDRKHIPDAVNAGESVLRTVQRTELLDVIPKPLAEACMRHGYCTAELTVWYITKQLILPPSSMRSQYKKRSSHLRKCHLPPLNKHPSGSKRCNID